MRHGACPTAEARGRGWRRPSASPATCRRRGCRTTGGRCGRSRPPAAPTRPSGSAERPEDLHARLPELGLELLGDRLVQVHAVGAPPSYRSSFSTSTPIARSASCMRTTGSSISGRPSPGGRLAVLHELVEHPRVAGGSAARTPPPDRGRRSSKVGIGLPPSPNHTCCQPWFRSPSITVGRDADVVEEHEVLAAVGDVLERPQLDARRVHRREEVADPLVPLRRSRGRCGRR